MNDSSPDRRLSSSNSRHANALHSHPAVSEDDMLSITPTRSLTTSSPMTTLHPECMKHSRMETPDHPEAVEPNAARVHHSRPGPVLGAKEGVFQAASPGKYSRFNDCSVPDAISNHSSLAIDVNANAASRWSPQRG